MKAGTLFLFGIAGGLVGFITNSDAFLAAGFILNAMAASGWSKK
ncbi:hypothetical protein [Methylophaga sp.]|nr:hypothetical protein [Methylophaga sp.]